MNNALKHLAELDMAYKRTRYTAINPNYIPKTKFIDTTANGLTNCIIKFIELNGWQAERISNTGRLMTSNKKIETSLGTLSQQSKWVTGTGTNGTSDISAVFAGRSVKIEVKIGPDRQSQAQKDYQESIERAGGVYILVRTFQSFYNWYYGFLKGLKNG